MTVLAWRRVGAPEGVPALRFAAQVDWLEDAGLAVVDLEDATARTRAAVALTLDGGHREVYTEALPLLQARGLPATAFVAAGGAGEAGRRLTWPMVRELHDAGWTVGSHGLEGRPLAGLTGAELERELHGGRAALEDALGVRCSRFAPVDGAVDRRLLDALLACGYTSVALLGRPSRALAGMAALIPRAPVEAATRWWLFRARARGWEEWGARRRGRRTGARG